MNMSRETKILVLVCWYALYMSTFVALAEPDLGGFHAQQKAHLRGLLKKETPVHTLTWSQISEWGVEQPELLCTSPGTQWNKVTNVGFNITPGAGYANPPLSCTAEKKWPQGYGYMAFTAVTSAADSVATNFSQGLQAKQIWHVSSESTPESVPTQLYYNMQFEPTWSIVYTAMDSSETTGFYVMKDLRVGYGPDGWWFGSDKCTAYADSSNGGVASFKCDVYYYISPGVTELNSKQNLRLTTGVNVNQLNFSLVDAF